MPAGNYTLTGGTFNLGSRSQSIGAFQITGGTITGSGTLTSSADYDVQAGTVGTILGGGAAIDLNKTGPGTAILSNNNTYAGLTTVSAGTLQLGTGSSMGSVAGNILIDPAGTLNVNRSDNSHLRQQAQRHGHAAEDRHGHADHVGLQLVLGQRQSSTTARSNYSGNSTLPAGNYTVTAGTLNVGTLSQSIGAFQITGGTVSGTGTLDQQRRLRRSGRHGQRQACRHVDRSEQDRLRDGRSHRRQHCTPA